MAAPCPPPPTLRQPPATPCLQVPIFDLLRRYDGVRVADDPRTGRRTFRLLKLPRFLILHVRRFSKNTFLGAEKNPTIVNFPVKGLRLGDVVPLPPGGAGRGKTGTAAAVPGRWGSRGGLCGERRRATRSGPRPAQPHNPTFPAPIISGAPSRYDLAANIVHDGGVAGGSYRAHVQRKAEGAWYEVQDLHVTEILPQVVALSETYVQVYEAAPESGGGGGGRGPGGGGAQGMAVDGA